MTRIQYRNTHLHDGLIGYWPLNGNSNDLIGGNNGTDTSISYVAGKLNDCANNGGVGYIVKSVPTGLETPTVSVSLWVNFNSILTNKYLFSKSVSGADNYAILSGYGGVGITFFFDGMTVAEYQSAAIPFSHSVGVWQYIVYTYDDYTIKGYKNGELSVSYVINKRLPLSAGGLLNFFAWNSGGSGTICDAKLDEIAVWNRALSEYEVKRLYNGGRGFKLY